MTTPKMLLYLLIIIRPGTSFPRPGRTCTAPRTARTSCRAARSSCTCRDRRWGNRSNTCRSLAAPSAAARRASADRRRHGSLGPWIPKFLRVRRRRLQRTPRFRENWRIALHYRGLLWATTHHGCKDFCFRRIRPDVSPRQVRLHVFSQREEGIGQSHKYKTNTL